MDSNDSKNSQGRFAEAPTGVPITYTLYGSSIAYGVIGILSLISTDGFGGHYVFTVQSLFILLSALFLVRASRLHRKNRDGKRVSLPNGNIRHATQYLFTALLLMPGCFLGWAIMDEPRMLFAALGSIAVILLLVGILASVQRRALLQAE